MNANDKKASTELVSVNAQQPITLNTDKLNAESLELINKIIEEPDVNKTQDLTYLFNINQNKKTIVRVNKLNELLDAITDQAVIRFTTKPDEISNKELMDGLKTVHDLIERSQNQVTAGVDQQPLIQINQQNNSMNLGEAGPILSRDSREKVKNVVMDLLGAITKPAPQPTTTLKAEDEIFEESEVMEETEPSAEEMQEILIPDEEEIK